jgi:hypothetical protein
MKAEMTVISKPVLFRVKFYAEMLQYYDLADIQPNVPMSLRSNFAYVQVWTPGLGTGSVSIYTQLGKTDIQRLRAMQVEDVASRDAKMNWLVYPGDYVRPCWTGIDGVGWNAANSIRVGACVYTNQLVMVDQVQTMRVKVPNSAEMRDMEMGRLVTFKKSDWGKTYASHPWLVQHVTGVHDDNVHNETPKGEVFLPLLDPLEFDIRPESTADDFRPEYWAYMETLKRE